MSIRGLSNTTAIGHIAMPVMGTFHCIKRRNQRVPADGEVRFAEQQFDTCPVGQAMALEQRTHGGRFMMSTGSIWSAVENPKIFA